MFAAAQTSTGAVTINAALVGARNAYKWNGSVQCGAGDIIAGNVYRATPLAALNSGSGGFVVDAVGAQNNIAVIPFIIDGGGAAITTGLKGTLPIPWNCNIISWAVDADQNGSISVDILRANNAHPTTSIIGGGTKPNLSAAQYNGFQVTSGWTSTSLNILDWIGFSVSTVATVTRVTVALTVGRI